MLPEQWSTLESSSAGISETTALLDLIDRVFVGGLTRITGDQHDALDELAHAVAGTPIGNRVAEAIDKITAGSVSEADITAIAIARTALTGAVHDALVSAFDTACGRERVESPPFNADTPATPPPSNMTNSCRSWLAELAVAGWSGVDLVVIESIQPTVSALLAHPHGRRLGVLLDGFSAELRALSPMSTAPELPLRRLADLWSRAMVSTFDPAPVPVDVSPVTGRFFVLGCDITEHPTGFGVRVHGVLEPKDGEEPLVLAAHLTASKVDTIVGPMMWTLLEDYPIMLAALADNRAIELIDMPRSSGNLLWSEDRATLTDTGIDLISVAKMTLPKARVSSIEPLDRHMAVIGELVVIEGYKVIKNKEAPEALEFDLGGTSLPIDTSRLSDCGPLTVKHLRTSTACIGLMRYAVEGWRLQPLAALVKIKTDHVVIHNGEWAKGPTDPKVAKSMRRNGDAVQILSERAERLLRA